ncbi:MAG TPA: tail fiber protein [Candidatus Dormibacteraeota bacterium]|jgi:microcystin-dependent protein
MGEPFLAEIKMVSFGYPPKGWALCNGQIMPINQNQALFSLLGTTYGGNGITTFALPNLQARVPIHVSSAHALGETAGEESHTLVTSELPAHTHTVSASSNSADRPLPGGNLPAVGTQAAYASGAPNVAMAPGAVGTTGGGQAHQNMPPFLVLNFVIALQGIFPSRN